MSAARSTRTSAKKKRGIPTGIPAARCLCFVPCRRRQHGISSGRIARGIQGLQPPRKRHVGVVDRAGRKRGNPLRGVKTGKQSLILPPLLRPVPPSAARDFVWEDCPRHPRASASRESDTPALRIGREENGESQPEFPLRGGPSGLHAASKGFALAAADKIGRKRPFRIRKRGIPTGIPLFLCVCGHYAGFCAETMSIIGRRISSRMPGRSSMLSGGGGSTTRARRKPFVSSASR